MKCRWLNAELKRDRAPPHSPHLYGGQAVFLRDSEF